jgi:hypothetical protein
MAIYGDLVAEHATTLTNYEPLPLSSTEPSSLSRVVDPSNSPDPTSLARHLLTLIPESPPLSLIIRLMFCLKPSNDDWDLPEFPYIFSNLDDEDLDLHKAFLASARPVRDDLGNEALQSFAEKVADLIGPKVRCKDVLKGRAYRLHHSIRTAARHTLLQESCAMPLHNTLKWHASLWFVLFFHT